MKPKKLSATIQSSSFTPNTGTNSFVTLEIETEGFKYATIKTYGSIDDLAKWFEFENIAPYKLNLDNRRINIKHDEMGYHFLSLKKQ